MTFHLKLIELPVVKATKLQRQAAEHSNKRESCGGVDNHSAEVRLRGEREALFGVALHLRQWLAGEEKGRVQIRARVDRMHEVAAPVRRLERTEQQITAGPYVFHPTRDKTREDIIGPRFEAFETATFDEVVAELAKTKSGLVIPEMPPGKPAKHNKGDTGGSAVAMLEAEADRLADCEEKQIRTRRRGRRQELTQNLDRPEGCRVLHKRQIDEVLDRPAPQQGPDTLV